MKSNFICKAPWVSMAFQPSGQVGPCCVYDLDHLVEMADPPTDTFHQLRSQFLDGKIPAGCNKCYQSFLETGKSPANGFDQFKTDFQHVAIQEINVKSNNICNLACRSCGPHFSSKWEEEFGTVIKITKDNLVYEKLKHIDINTLKRVVVAGGEPTLTQEHVDVLQNLIDNNRTDVEIRIATNVTSLKYKQIDLLKLWKNFPKLVLQLSIDAVGDKAVAVRSGSDWQSIENNIQAIIDAGIKFYVNITVSALNIWFLEETLNYLKSKFGIHRNIIFNLLTGPDYLNLQVIPDEYRGELYATLDRCLAAGYDITQIREFMSANQKSNLWSHFLIYNLMLDQIRNEKFFNLLPIKQSLINQWLK